MNKIISALVATTISTAPAYADQLKVVTDIPPVHGIVDAILGADANITSLISSGMDPHNFSMKPSHAAALSQADLVVFIGASLTPSLAEKLSSLAAGTKIIELEDIPNVHLIGYEDAHEEHVRISITKITQTMIMMQTTMNTTKMKTNMMNMTTLMGMMINIRMNTTTKTAMTGTITVVSTHTCG